MDAFRQDLRFAWRTLLSRRGFTLVAVLTLALGIGATTAIFSVVHGVLLRPLPYAQSDRLVHVWQSAKDSPPGERLLSHPNFQDVGAEARSIESISQVDGVNLTVSADGGAELVRGGEVSDGFFHVFRAPLLLGREFTALEDRYQGPLVAVISEGYWRERLGARSDVVGSTIRIGGADHEIVGVVRAGFSYPDDARIWVPVQNNDEGCGRGCVTHVAVARLAAGATLGQANAELAALHARLEKAYPRSSAGGALVAASMRSVVVGDVQPALVIVLGAVLMVLLIACANVANLQLVRGNGRVTEIAVRSTLGANRRRLLSQLLTESALLAVLGAVAGVALAAWGVDALRRLAPSDIPRLDEVRLDAITLLFASALAGASALLFGLAPALNLSRVELATALRRGGRGDVNAGRSGVGRSAILAAETALSVILLLGAGLMVRSMVRLTRVQPGFDTRGVMQFRLSLPDARYPTPDDNVLFMDRVREELSAVPGIDSVGIMVAAPLTGISLHGGFTRTDQPPPEPGRGPQINYRVTDGYGAAMLHVRLLQGRGFSPADRHGGQGVALISQSTAQQYFPGEDAVGKVIQLHISTGYEEDAPRTIVGVFADVRAGRLSASPQPELWIPYAQAGSSFPNVLLRGSLGRRAMIESARGVLRSLDPELPLIRPVPLDTFVAEQLAQPRFYLLLLGLFAVLAVALAAVGIFGVVAFAVSQRTREIGVRIALGARIEQVIRLVMLQGLRPAVAGVIIGLLGGLAGTRLMQALLYDVAPRDPVTFALVPLVLLAVVGLACALPARRATRIPPSVALRSE